MKKRYQATVYLIQCDESKQIISRGRFRFKMIAFAFLVWAASGTSYLIKRGVIDVEYELITV